MLNFCVLKDVSYPVFSEGQIAVKQRRTDRKRKKRENAMSGRFPQAFTSIIFVTEFSIRRCYFPGFVVQEATSSLMLPSAYAITVSAAP